MKDMLLLLLQIVAGVCLIGFILSVIGMLWGKPMSLKGAEVPADWRAALSFFVATAILGGIVYLAERKKP